MNIQIYGKQKCFDTKKTQRYFKERGISFQMVDVLKYGMSRGEFESVKKNVNCLDDLIDTKAKDKQTLALIKYLSKEAAEEKLLENPGLLRTPIVRNGKCATVGYQPEVWKDWH